MNFAVFCLVFACAVFAANAIYPLLRRCDQKNLCDAPMGCFKVCYGHLPSPFPVCENICVDKKMKCQTNLNCPNGYDCENFGRATKSGFCRPIMIGK